MWQQDSDGRVRHFFEPIVIAATLALIPVLIMEADVDSPARIYSKNLLG
jgi:hypothetical protein